MKTPACPTSEHLLVARVTGRGGVDLHTPAALQEYLEGRHYEEVLSWPEQGLEVYLVGAAVDFSVPQSKIRALCNLRGTGRIVAK